MNSSKAWAILTTRTLLPSMAPGGVPILTASVIARLLQGLERGRFLMGMAKEAGDMTVLSKLEDCLWKATPEIAAHAGWYVPANDPECRRLAGLAVYETLIPRPVPCVACHGRGFRYNGAAHIECFECRNTTGGTLSSRSRSELACITWSSWQHRWQERYEDVHRGAEGWVSDARRHLARGLDAFAVAA